MGVLAGRSTPSDAPAITFSGWLELLQALESASTSHGVHQGVETVDSADGVETLPAHEGAGVVLAVALGAGGLSVASRVLATSWSVNSDATLRAALHPTSGAQNGETITFTSNITITADLPVVRRR